MSENLQVHVLFRAGKKTGKIDMTITALGSALLKMWAMNNTTATKRTLIFNRDTGACVFAAEGKKNDMPTFSMDLGTCDEYGISLEDLQAVKDDRFDK